MNNNQNTNKGMYKVGLPNGHTWIYYNKRKAENAALIARALAAMPSYPNKDDHTTLGKYGQQSALAKVLGYVCGPNTSHPGKARHADIYTLLERGHLPRSPERLAKLRELAATVPEDWFEKCPCLAEHEAEHQH